MGDCWRLFEAVSWWLLAVRKSKHLGRDIKLLSLPGASYPTFASSSPSILPLSLSTFHSSSSSSSTGVVDYCVKTNSRSLSFASNIHF